MKAELTELIDHLKVAERMVVDLMKACEGQRMVDALHECKMAIWKAGDYAADAEREVQS